MTRETRHPVAIVTGASKGLGRALAEGLARDGWQLIITARTASTLAETRRELLAAWPVPTSDAFGGTPVVAIPGDVTDADHRAAIVAAAERLGGVDLVVNNAGALGPSPLPAVIDADPDALRGVLETNVIAPHALVRDLADAFQPGARIVNVTSDAAINAYPGWGLYGASKLALEHLGRVLAEERPDLRMYRVDPGDLRTEMHQAAFPGEDISDRPLPETVVPGFLALLRGDRPSGRYEAAALVPEATTGEVPAPVSVGGGAS